MKLSLVIEAIDKASSNVKRITGNVRDLGTRGMGVVQRATQGANRQLDRFGRGTAGRLRTLSVAAARFAGRTGLRAIEIGAEKAGWALGRLIRKGFDLAASTAKWGVAAAGFFAGWGVKSIIQTASQFEQFQVSLENTLGSAQKAKAALAWIQKFAQTTPYELREVTKAFVDLKNRGMDAADGTLRALGDMASALNLPLDQAVEMIADAQTFQFERLREFGITATKAGNDVTFSYQKNNKEVRKTVRQTAAEVRKAIVDISTDRFGGMMNKQSGTLGGMWRNLMDMVTKFQLDIANAGFFDKVKGKLQQLLDKVNELAANGTLERWAKNISDWLSQAVDWLTKFFEDEQRRKAFIDDLKLIGRGVWLMAKNFAWVVEKANALYGIIEKVNPLTGGLMGWLWRNGVGGQDSGAPATPWGSRSARTASEPTTPATPRGRAAPLKPGHQPIKWPATSRAGGSSSAGAVQVGGRLEIELKGSGARDARVRTVQSANNNVPISITANRGRAMETFG